MGFVANFVAPPRLCLMFAGNCRRSGLVLSGDKHGNVGKYPLFYWEIQSTSNLHQLIQGPFSSHVVVGE